MRKNSTPCTILSEPEESESQADTAKTNALLRFGRKTSMVGR